MEKAMQLNPTMHDCLYKNLDLFHIRCLPYAVMCHQSKLDTILYSYIDYSPTTSHDSQSLVGGYKQLSRNLHLGVARKFR